MSHHDHHNGNAAATTVNLLPAGAKDSHKPGHHGHTIVPLRLLVGVLVILLVFTVLTVSAANMEQWYARTFDVVIPGWVNAVVALSIACVKSIIVAMYFMQLRYDQNPMNALVAVFTVMVATFFLGFIAIDLGNRGIIYQNKADPIIPGGVGGISRTVDGKEEQIAAGTSIAVHARQRADAFIEQAVKDGAPITNHAYRVRLFNRYHELEANPALDETGRTLAASMKAYMDRHRDEYEQVAAYVAAHSHGHGPAHGGHEPANTANISRARTGVTLTELGAAPGHGHGNGHAPGHQAEPAHRAPANEPAKDKPAAGH
ncbi:MAG TPA: cytochrome C oxidase subunit IV family protein [Phycisphaerales bacterium]|nr:cytochrome C oxidase subunit IV family protein [Phycisphaerales bacterium]